MFKKVTRDTLTEMIQLTEIHLHQVEEATENFLQGVKRIDFLENTEVLNHTQGPTLEAYYQQLNAMASLLQKQENAINAKQNALEKVAGIREKSEKLPSTLRQSLQKTLFNAPTTSLEDIHWSSNQLTRETFQQILALSLSDFLIFIESFPMEVRQASYQQLYYYFLMDLRSERFTSESYMQTLADDLHNLPVLSNDRLIDKEYWWWDGIFNSAAKHYVIQKFIGDLTKSS
ncbi:hypothetical protein [Peribacillus asahii]|uniref:hypothetical protein n=1 Tax=Peribacillus asahii TaxID=228899 RepID=UPI00207AA727|nr:hypothetical protein [Peribacillus asahii]USK62325.1 hypothetical protein LIT37_22770 [Peribacillus asahii]